MTLLLNTRRLTCTLFALVLIGCGSASNKAADASPSLSSVPVDASSVSSIDTNASSLSSVTSSNSSVSSSSSSVAPTPSYATDTYGLYVVLGRPGEQDVLLGNAAAEQAMLTFVRDNGFNYLVFYDAFNRALLNDRDDDIASLIHRAKTDYDVRAVGVALGDGGGADLVVEYNTNRPASERIDVLNLEFEFWNQTPRADAFALALDALEQFKEVGGPEGLLTETYVGWLEREEGEALAKVLDRVLVHYYRTSDVGNVQFGIERLEYMGTGREGMSPLRFLPIFSSEGPLNTLDLPFMGTWLETHPHEQAKETWTSEYDALEATWKSTLHLEGASWYVYDKFLDVRHTTSHITTHPQPQSVCEGGGASFTVATSVSQADYCWMYQGACLVDGNGVQGATTANLQLSSVTSAQAGNYYARVISRDATNPQSFASTVAELEVIACPQ